MDKKTINILEFDKIIKKLEDIASSELGKEIASNLMPSRDIKVVSELLEQTNDGVEFILKKGNPPLGGIHNIKDSLKKAEIGGVLTPGEIMRIGDTLRAAENLKKYGKDMSEKGDTNNTVAFMIKGLVGNKAIEEKIGISIVGEDEISDNASAALRKIRTQIKTEQISIKDKLESIIKSSANKKFMQDSIVTMRQDRYVIPVKQEYKNEIPGLVHDLSSSGATIFIEPIAAVDANNKIKQLQMKERDEIERILRELTNDIIGIMDSLLSNIEIFAQLDFIFAKAKYSLQSNCMCPKINNDGMIIISIMPSTLVKNLYILVKNFDSLTSIA